MSFVYPGFLWALLLLAVPIIIHLFHFRRYKKILFPNVRFLQNVQKETQSVKRLRNFLVLLARMLAIAALVLAFAQPYIPLSDQLEQGDQIVGIYIDNSFSMENQGSRGPLFEEAKEKARQLVKAYPNSDRFIIHTNHSNSIHPINGDDAIAFIDGIDIQKTSRSLPEVLEVMSRSLEDNGMLNKQLYVLSDLQRNERADYTSYRDTSTRLSLIPLEANGNNNVSIDTAWLKSPVVNLNKPIELVVELTNHGEDDLNGVSLALDINGSKKAVTSLDIGGKASQKVNLGFALNQAGWQEASLRIEDAPIIFDDVYHLSFNIKPRIEILIANGNEANPVFDRLFRSETSFFVQNQASGNLDLGSLRRADLVILNELNNVSNGMVEALKTFVADGGTLFVVPSKTGQSDYLQNLTQSLGLMNYAKPVEQSTRVGSVGLDHPLFRNVLESVRGNTDLPKVFKYFRMEAGAKSSDMLMALDNRDMFLVSSKLERGEIFQLAVPLSESWSNSAEHGLFLSLMLRMVTNRSLDFPLAYFIGNQNLFKSVPEAKNLQGELELRQGETQWMPVVSNRQSSPFVDAGYDNLEAGHVALYHGDSLLQLAAFNFDRAESANAYLTSAELEEKLPGVEFDLVENPTTYVKDTVTELRFGKRYWKWCIIAALIFLAIEILLLRFWPTEAKQ